VSNIVHHRDEATNLWGKAGNIADQKEVSFIHTIPLVQFFYVTNKWVSSRTTSISGAACCISFHSNTYSRPPQPAGLYLLQAFYDDWPVSSIAYECGRESGGKEG